MEPTVCQVNPVSLLKLTSVETGPVPEVELSIAREIKLPTGSTVIARPRRCVRASVVSQVDWAKVAVSGENIKAAPSVRRCGVLVFIELF